MTTLRRFASPILITAGLLGLVSGSQAGLRSALPSDQAQTQSETQSQSQPQSQSQLGFSVSQAGADAPQITFEKELPWLLRRAAILDLRLHESPLPEDYELTAKLLSMSSDLDPENAETAREMAQAAWLAGDQDQMLEATRRIIRIEPKDTVALLRLISANINKKQTVEERRELYDRFLGDAGASIDPSVRSRLALDAALLERESGNTRGFIERLHQATRLDITNKAAASLAAQYYSSVSANPATNLDYQVRLLNADPLDANVHMSIARLLASQGALESATRFLLNSIELYKLETGEVSESIEEIRIAIEWQVKGPDEVMQELNAVINTLRQNAIAKFEAYERQQLPTDDIKRPEEIRYSLSVDKLRLLAAHSEGHSELTRSVLDDIERSVNAELQRLAMGMRQRGANINALLGQVFLRIAELQAMRAIVGLDAEKIREDIGKVIEAQPIMADRMGSIEPMALFAEGKFEEALELSGQFESSPVVALVRGQSFERLGRNEEAIDLYKRLTHSNALNAYGAFANTRLHGLGAGDQIMTQAGRQMDIIAKNVPEWFDEMIERPGSYFYLDVQQDQRLIGEGDQPELTIRLQNTAPIPLALGPSAPIDSRMLIEPVGVNTQHNGFMGDPRPKILQLDHRLRLEPREELIVHINADSASTDWLIDQQPDIAIRQRWRLIQSYKPRVSDTLIQQQRPDPRLRIYGITNSPLGLTAETKVTQRLGLSTLNIEPDALLESLRSGDASIRRRAAVTINARLMSSNEELRFDPPTLEVIIGALNEAYTTAKPAERAAMMLSLPQRHQVPAMISFDDHVAALLVSDALIDSDIDPLVVTCALLTRTDDPEAPIFETLAHVSESSVLRLADIVRARLRENRPLLGTVGPGTEAMTPSFDGLEY